MKYMALYKTYNSSLLTNYVEMYFMALHYMLRMRDL